MSFFTLGLYNVYWFYWNWREQYIRTGEPTRPGLRTFLSPFVAYLLFRDVKRHPGSNASWSAGVLAFAYLILLFAFVAPGGVGFLTLFAFVPLIPVQAAMNRVHATTPGGEAADRKFSALNIAGMLAGAFVIFILIAASIVVDEAMIREAERQMRLIYP